MNNFSFHPEADEEFVEAVAYYEDCESGLGLDVAREIHAAIQNARDYPTQWPQIEDDVRRCLVHRFPYGVLYSAETHGIFILAAVLAGGCVQTVNRTPLDAAIRSHDHETVNGVSYAGTKDGYHYIWDGHTIGSDMYRIPASELKIDPPFPLTKDRAKWRTLKEHGDMWGVPKPQLHREYATPWEWYHAPESHGAKPAPWRWK